MIKKYKNIFFLIVIQLFVDFHGHSRKKNVFMYGCQEKQPNEASEMVCTATTSAGNTSVKSPPSVVASKDDTSSYCSSLDFYNEESTAKVAYNKIFVTFDLLFDFWFIHANHFISVELSSMNVLFSLRNIWTISMD